MNADGVGWFRVRGRKTTARRYAYRAEHGDLPGQVRVRVRCGHRACCNPAHLGAAAARQVAVSNGSAAAKNLVVTHCPAGHPYDGPNTAQVRGRRVCRTCRRSRPG